jgi:hypothetical protein
MDVKTPVADRFPKSMSRSSVVSFVNEMVVQRVIAFTPEALISTAHTSAS